MPSARSRLRSLTIIVSIIPHSPLVSSIRCCNYFPIIDSFCISPCRCVRANRWALHPTFLAFLFIKSLAHKNSLPSIIPAQFVINLSGFCYCANICGNAANWRPNRIHWAGRKKVSWWTGECSELNYFRKKNCNRSLQTLAIWITDDNTLNCKQSRRKVLMTADSSKSIDWNVIFDRSLEALENAIKWSFPSSGSLSLNPRGTIR